MSFSVKLSAACGTVSGLGTIAIVWAADGLSSQADQWLLALTITQNLTLLSQIGVEQIAVFSRESATSVPSGLDWFNKLAIYWAAFFGILFASVCVLTGEGLVYLFGAGLDESSRTTVLTYLLFLAAQVAAAPAAYSAKQLLLLEGRAVLGLLVGVTSQIILFIAALIAFVFASNDYLIAAKLSAVGNVCLITLICLKYGFIIRPSGKIPSIRFLSQFLIESAKLRTVSSVHNLLVSMIANTALSQAGTGAISIFSYAKRAADSVMSVTAAPHLSIYHAKQIRSWTSADYSVYNKNKQRLIRDSMFWYVAAWAAGCALVVGIAITYPAVLKGLNYLYLLMMISILCLWNAVIFLESSYLPSIIILKQNRILFGVNSLFVAMFWTITVAAAPISAAGLGVTLATLQCLSLVLYRKAAIKNLKGHFGKIWT